MIAMNLKKILQHQRKFVKARQWEQFHTPKNLAAALSVEASELLEIFQWLRGDEDDPLKLSKEARDQIADEIADIFFFVARFSDVMGIDLEAAFWKKMKKNARKYPARLARGNATKYTRLKRSAAKR